MLKSASRIFAVESGSEKDGKRPRATLQFSFREDPIPSRINEPYTTFYRYVRLNAAQLSNFEESILQYDFKVMRLEEDEEKNETIWKNTPWIRRGFLQHDISANKIDLIGKLITIHDGCGSHDQPEKLRIKMSVRPLFMSDHLQGSAASQEGTPHSIETNDSLPQALKNMFSAEKNHSDLRLDTKDNMTLSAHRFILAARSSFLRHLIDKEVMKVDSFNAAIKLDVNAKPMIAILHWMYTEELQESAGRFMDEVVDAAIQFKLTGLLKILDRKLIRICNTENMFHLFQVAKKNGMLTATDDISKFIKGNV